MSRTAREAEARDLLPAGHPNTRWTWHGVSRGYTPAELRELRLWAWGEQYRRAAEEYGLPLELFLTDPAEAYAQVREIQAERCPRPATAPQVDGPARPW